MYRRALTLMNNKLFYAILFITKYVYHHCLIGYSTKYLIDSFNGIRELVLSGIGQHINI